MELVELPTTSLAEAMFEKLGLPKPVYHVRRLEQGGYKSQIEFHHTKERFHASANRIKLSSPICEDGETSMNRAADLAIEYMETREKKAFPKGSPLVGDISKAILSVIGGDTINQIEKKWIGIGYQNNCNNAGRAPDPEKLTPDGFTGLFILSGVVSTSSLLIAVVIYFYEKKRSTTKTQTDQKGDQAEGSERGNEAGEEMQNIGVQTSDLRRNVSWGFRRSFGTRVAPVSTSSRF